MGSKMNKKESHKPDLARLFDEFFELTGFLTDDKI